MNNSSVHKVIITDRERERRECNEIVKRGVSQVRILAGVGNYFRGLLFMLIVVS